MLFPLLLEARTTARAIPRVALDVNKLHLPPTLPVAEDHSHRAAGFFRRIAC